MNRVYEVTSMRTAILLLAILLEVAAAQTPGTVKWMTPITGEGWGNPTVAPDGTIYYATHRFGGILYRIRGSDGAILAAAPAPGLVEHSAALGDNGILYINTLAGPMAGGLAGQKYAAAFRADTLAPVWQTQLQNGADTSPILGRNNRVYLGLVSSPASPNPFAGRKYHSFDATTGQMIVDMFVEGWAATPGAVDETGRIFFGVEDLSGWPAPGPSGIWPGVFYALTPDDPPPGGTTPALAWPPFHAAGDFGSPVSCADGVVYTTCRDGNLYGFAAFDGTVVFQRSLGAPSWCGIAIGRNPATGRKVLYTGTQNIDIGQGGQGRIFAIEDDGTPSGQLLWSHPVPGGFAFGCPALDDLGNIYATTSVGLLQCRSSGGTLLWSYMLPAGASLGGIGGPTILNDGAVVTGSNGGFLVALFGSGNHLADDVPWPKYKHDLRNTANVLTPIRDAGPPITGVSATDAAVAGIVTIRGSFFTAPNTVLFDGVPAAVASESFDTITVTTQAGVPRFANVTVQNALGSVTAGGAAEFLPTLRVTTTGLGGSADVRLNTGGPGPCVVAAGTGVLGAPIPVPGVSFGLFLDLAAPWAVLATGVLPDATPLVLSFPVANNPAFAGLTFHVQGVAQKGLDPLTATVSFTNAASVTF